MKLLGSFPYHLRQLGVPWDFRSWLEREDIRALARNLKAVGVIEEPVVREGSFEVVTGLEVVAAAWLTGSPSITVRLMECNESEMKAMREQERLRTKAHVDHAAKVEAEVLAEEGRIDEETLPMRGNRRRSKRAEAIERISTKRGVTEAAIRQALWRQRKKKRNESVTPRIDDLGMVLDEAWLGKVRDVQERLNDINTHIVSAVKVANKLDAVEGLPFTEARLQKIRADLQELGSYVRGCSPFATCPWCKGFDGVQEQCAACEAQGWVGKAKFMSAPKELLDRETPMVVHEGKLRYASDFIQETAPEGDDVWGDLK